MTKTMKCCVAALVSVGYAQYCLAAEGQLLVTTKNNLEIARPSETIELSWQDIKKALPALHPARVRVKDKRSGTELRSQVVDTDGDGCPDQLIFQSDFKPNETRAFVLKVLHDWKTKQDSLVHAAYYDLRDVARHGKVVDEDDFAWENDRIAFRLYGPTTSKLPFDSSGVDVWTKRVPYLILDKWHDSVKTFHRDYGEGGDFYAVGESRGCGGTGIWKDGKIYVSGNFSAYKVIANGPIRLIFEVYYKPWDVDGTKVSEVKRISLDAGQNLSRHDVTFQSNGDKEITYAIGLGKFKGATFTSDEKNAWMGLWGPAYADPKINGELGTGVVVDKSRFIEFVSTTRPWTYAKMPGHYLAVAKAKVGACATHYTGAAWVRGGHFLNAKDWFTYLGHFSKRLRSPLKISIFTCD